MLTEQAPKTNDPQEYCNSIASHIVEECKAVETLEIRDVVIVMHTIVKVPKISKSKIYTPLFCFATTTKTLHQIEIRDLPVLSLHWYLIKGHPKN